jgi:hypothetical protein
MKKIIAAFDGLKYSKGTRDYAIYLAKQTHTHLVGVFLEDPLYTSYKVYDLLTEDGVSGDKLKVLEANDTATRKASVEDFEKLCQHNGLEYNIHHDHKTALLELKHESVYADLLIIDAEETLTHYPEALPTRFIRDLLTDVQCPVLVVPAVYEPLQKIILLYDGEPSSVQALKMFSYLLPQLKHLDTEIITVKPFGSSMHLPDNRLIKEFIKRHYPSATYMVIEGLPEDEIIAQLIKMKENPLLVLGAYKRGMLSRWFKESMADILMKELKTPLFIAH